MFFIVYLIQGFYPQTLFDDFFKVAKDRKIIILSLKIQLTQIVIIDEKKRGSPG